jgi:hypothetical protein
VRCERCPLDDVNLCDGYYHAKRLGGLIGHDGTKEALTERERWLVGLLPKVEPEPGRWRPSDELLDRGDLTVLERRQTFRLGDGGRALLRALAVRHG